MPKRAGKHTSIPKKRTPLKRPARGLRPVLTPDPLPISNPKIAGQSRLSKQLLRRSLAMASKPFKVLQKRFSVPMLILIIYIVLVAIIVIKGALDGSKKSLISQPTPAPSAAIEQVKESWCKACKAVKISIPKINFTDERIVTASYDGAQRTWPTPEKGLATTQEPIPNNIIVFGHSKWLGQERPFANISNLNVGDLIVIWDQAGKEYQFIVDKVQLSDRMDGSAVQAKDNVTLTLLTSAKYSGEWLLPQHIDASASAAYSEQTYLILVVTAKQSSM